MAKIRAISLLVALLLFVPLLFAEKKGPGDGNEGEPVTRYAIEEPQGRNFEAWWGDHAVYLIVPREYGYVRHSLVPNRVLKLLLTCGYRGEFEAVANNQAIEELRNTSGVVKFLGALVNGRYEFKADLLPGGIRNDDLRMFAAIALGEMGGAEALPFLVDVLSADSPELRACAAVSIGKLGGIEHRDKLISAFRTSPRTREPYLRSAYLTALAHLGDPGVLPELIANLNDRDARVRRSLATVFGIMAEDAGPGVVTDYLRRHSKIDAVRMAAIWALADMGRDIADRHETERYTGTLAEIENEMIRLYRHEIKPFLRRNALFAFAHLGTPTLNNILQSISTDPENENRLAATAALFSAGERISPSKYDDPAFAHALRTMQDCRVMLDTTRPNVAPIARGVRELTVSGTPEAALGIIHYAARSASPVRLMLIEGEYDSPNTEVAIGAVVATGMIRGRLDTSRASSTLHRLANTLPSVTKDDEFARYRVAATYTSLGMLGGDWPLNLLLNKVSASDQLTAISAALSLSLLGGIPYREPLINTMQNSNNPADVRTAAVFSLGMTKAPGVLEALINTATLGSNVDLRAHAIFALALNGDSTAVPALHSIISDARLARSADGNYLRGCAALSLVKLGAGPAHILALKREMEKSDDENFVAFSALSLGLSRDPGSLEAIIPLLDSSSRNVRMAAALGLGFSGDEAYLPELQKIARTAAQAETRVHAAVGCGLLGDPSASDTLLSLIDPASEGNSGVRLASAIGLMLLGGKDAQVVKRLAATANDPDMRVRKYASIARFVLGDDAGLDSFVDSLRTGGMECKKLDSQLLQFWANASLPPFFKLRSYLFN